ncbi:hypothetical protein CVT91_07255 [Candidatus Atribacteria bacterium HGW-Atribacteria-1]|nr:MAG: hypothetical protein CVT91_07255 [Candidatus Atribacteria bacterium HGW-Atribacteria-1]
MLKINRKLSQSGFSLIELMVAVAILALAIFGIFHAYSAGFMGMADARDRTVATNYAREAMEDIKNMDFDQIVTQSRNYIDGTKYEREVIVQPSTNLKKVTTKMYWKDRNGNTKMVETDMVVYFIETTAGTATKIILYANPYNVLTQNITDPGNIDETKSIITAVIKDAKGNTVTTGSVSISFSITTGSTLGSILPEDVSSVEGKATTIFTASSKGEVIITASANGLTDGSVTIKITDPNTPVKINLTANPVFMTATTSSISQITATVVNAGGATVTNPETEITFSVSGPGTLSTPTTKTTVSGVTTIDLTSNGTPGTITVTASASGLEPGVINIITGGKIYLSALPKIVPVNEKSVITVTTKDMNGVPINYVGTINLSVESTGGSGTLSSNSSNFNESTYNLTFNGSNSSETVIFTASGIGDVKITSKDIEPTILTPENELILTIIPELNPDHIEVHADPSSIKAGGKETSTITARVKDKKFIPITSYTKTITFKTDKGYFPNSLQVIDTDHGSVTYVNGVATVELSSYLYDITGIANISVTSNYYGKIISGNTRVGFYSAADHIDLIAKPQSILTGGGSEGTCTIIATIKDGVTVVSGYTGTVTFTIEEGHPHVVKFTSTGKSSITVTVVSGVATIELKSKDIVGKAKIKAIASDGISDIESYLYIPVVANKNLEIFLLYRNGSNNFLNYYYPADGSQKGSWSSGNITYGKFCVDSNNNLYIIKGNYIEKKSSREAIILTSKAIETNIYTINIGPNGYIYFTQNTGTDGSPKYCIKKLNPNTLEIEDILNLIDGKLYYGFAIDSVENIYIHNYDDKKIEKWNFKDGFTGLSLNLGYNYEFSELAIAGDFIGGIEKNVNAFKILKTSAETETQFTLNDIPNLKYISSIGGDFLFSGLDTINQIVFGRYDTGGTNKWFKVISDTVYSDCIIGAYPF